MHLCPVTGKECSCPMTGRTDVGNAMLMDYKSALRSVLTDHAVYTSLLIIESLPVNQPDSQFVAERLLKNPKDIRNLVEPIIGEAKGKVVEDLFTEHLTLAAGCLTYIRNGDNNEVQNYINKFFANGEQIAAALSSLNPAKLDYETAKTTMYEHNKFVVELAMLRKEQKYGEYITKYDVYYKHILMFADTLNKALA